MFLVLIEGVCILFFFGIVYIGIDDLLLLIGLLLGGML